MSGIYHREITALLPFIRRRSIIIALSRQFISAPNANWEIKQRHRGHTARECRRDAWKKEIEGKSPMAKTEERLSALMFSTS